MQVRADNACQKMDKPRGSLKVIQGILGNKVYYNGYRHSDYNRKPSKDFKAPISIDQTVPRTPRLAI